MKNKRGFPFARPRGVAVGVAGVPNLALKKTIENPKLLSHVEAQTHRIACPYCQIGFIYVRVEVNRCGKQQEVHIPKIHEPHKCETCGKWSVLRTQMKIIAVKKAGEEKNNGNE